MVKAAEEIRKSICVSGFDLQAEWDTMQEFEQKKTWLAFGRLSKLMQKWSRQEAKVGLVEVRKICALIAEKRLTTISNKKEKAESDFKQLETDL